MSDRVPVRQCQRRLLVLWGTLSSLAAIIVLVQTSPGGAYGRNAPEVWDWFLPTIVPTLSLMIGGVVADARNPGEDDTVDSFTYRLTLFTSTLYMAFVVTNLLMYAQSANPVADLKASGKTVSTLYAIVGIVIGAFFVSKKTRA